MIGEAERARTGEDLAEKSLALDEGESSQIIALYRKEIENVSGRGMLDDATLDVQGPRQLRPLLQSLEARPAVLVEHHDLAIHDQLLEGQRSDGSRDFRKRGAHFVAATVEEASFAALAREKHAISVVLELEKPLLARKRLLAGLREHQPRVADTERTLPRAEPFETSDDLRSAPAARSE